MGRQNVVDILCRRDEIDEREANELIDEALDSMMECNYDPEECESILADVLGLEPDYIFDLLL